MIFYHFCQFLDELEKTPSRLAMTSQLADLFAQLDQEEVPAACYLMLGRLVPRYQTLEFNMSAKLTMRSIARLLAFLQKNDTPLPDTNLFNQKDYSYFKGQIRAKYKEVGDLGSALTKQLKSLESSLSLTKKFKKLSISHVYQALTQIAQEEGEGSQERKIQQLFALLKKLKPLAAKFVVRIVVGKLRLGFSTMTIIDALSWSKHQDKTDRAKIESAYQKKADIGKLAQGYLAAHNQSAIKQFLASYEVELGIPVVPALCQRLNTADEVIEKMKQVVVEPKYDGLRAQLHLNTQTKECQVFTRNLDEVSYMFPELKQALNLVKLDSCILDAEAIAYDKETGKLLSFQKTITRKRKHDVKAQAEKTPIRFYVFDLLYKNGQSLVGKPLLKRRKELKRHLKNNHILVKTDYIVTNKPDEIRQYHLQQLGQGLEGAVMKRVDSIYKGGRKGWRWVKMKEKEGEEGKLNDTLDCIVLGYYQGKGKRSSFGIGAFLVGILAKAEVESGRAKKNNQIKTVAKIGTGLTDEQFKKIKKLADQAKAEQKPDQYQVPKELTPDTWVYPEIVVEIAADEITKSPLHSAGQALRFPRLISFRSDKDWEQATTLDELEGIKLQS